MCGIFGVVGRPSTDADIQAKIQNLFIRSESRGKEASGLFAVLPEKIVIFKSPERASKMIKGSLFGEFLTRALDEAQSSLAAFVGHSRLVTNGSREEHSNNQPVIGESLVVVHNGIITNHRDLSHLAGLPTPRELDTSSFVSLVEKRIFEDRMDLPRALHQTVSEIKGTYSLVVAHKNSSKLYLSTNNGSLYFLSKGGQVFFASERTILKGMVDDFGLGEADENIVRIPPHWHLTIDLIDGATNFWSDLPSAVERLEKAGLILDQSPSPKKQGVKSQVTNKFIVLKEIERDYEASLLHTEKLLRCSRCVLPETFPGIYFGNDGICNVCKNYKIRSTLPVDQILQKINPLSNRTKDFDVLVPLSGGRDSCYSLHFLVKELGLRPLAFTYDWGMVTDLARRNQARLCGALGVEHILISADINFKRRNIRENVAAWLKRPHLGMVPLFMAGDKHYFYYSNKLMADYDLKGAVMGENHLEATGFKSGFAVRSGSSEKAYVTSSLDRLKLMTFFSKQYLSNFGYLNASLFDTIFAFSTYYFIDRPYLNLFDYVKWDEGVVVNTIVNQYEWELSPDSNSSWRIGDGTTPFYNFIYQTVAGFCELDTFRSNQIREGIISRSEALRLLREERQPRWESIRWYFDAIGLDMNESLRRVQSIPKLYRTEAGANKQQEF